MPFAHGCRHSYVYRCRCSLGLVLEPSPRNSVKYCSADQLQVGRGMNTQSPCPKKRTRQQRMSHPDHNQTQRQLTTGNKTKKNKNKKEPTRRTNFRTNIQPSPHKLPTKFRHNSTIHQRAQARGNASKRMRPARAPRLQHYAWQFNPH